MIIKCGNELQFGTIMNQNSHIGHPIIMAPEFMQTINTITSQNWRMSTQSIVDILNSSN